MINCDNSQVNCTLNILAGNGDPQTFHCPMSSSCIRCVINCITTRSCRNVQMFGYMCDYFEINASPGGNNIFRRM